MVLKRGIEVLGLGFGIGHEADRSDGLEAGIEKIHPRIAVLIEGEAVMHLHPACHPLVIAGRKIDPVPACALGNAFPARAVPDGGIGNAVNNLSSLQQGVLTFELRKTAELLVGVRTGLELRNMIFFCLWEHWHFLHR